MSLSVFLCHSSGDKDVVRELYGRLKEDGFDPWLDEVDILGGQDWDYEISMAVRRSDAVVVCLSKGSVDKRGYVQKEIKIALDVADEQPEGAIFIIPTKLEECDVPQRLRRWQWVSLYESNGYERLVASLQRRASDLRLNTEEITSVEEAVEDSIYDEDTNLEANTHMIFPCDLKEGDKIRIDFKSDDHLDVLIMDEGDYQEWTNKGAINLLYKDYLKREQLHTHFTAPEDGTYLIIVRNELDDEVAFQLKIDHAD